MAMPTGIPTSSSSTKSLDLTLKSTGQRVVLTPADFKAQGGEGSIYVKGGTAYKIYTEPKNVISERKIQELAVLREPNIIRPQEMLLDARGKAVGYTMRAIPDSYALCQLFPKAFRDRHKLTTEQIVELIRKLQAGVKHIHEQGILLVDLNELNFLVDKSFKDIYFIDVDSYQTKSFPAQVLMPSVRDYQTKGFNENTDWYAWGIVTFQMLIGIHPYKGKHPTIKGSATVTALEERMRKGVSVFNDEVTIPATCMPFDILPNALRDWYEAVFERGERIPPPDKYESKIVTTARVQRQQGSNNYIISLMYTFKQDISLYHHGYVLTTNGIYKDGKILVGLKDVVELAVTPDTMTPVLARLEYNRLKLFNALSKVEIPANVMGEDMMSYDGRLYVKNGGSVFEVQFMELGKNLIITPKKVGNVVENSTHMFEGVVISNIIDQNHFYVFPRKETCYQILIPELTGYQIVDAKYDKGVLVVVGQKGGRYDKFIVRFADDHRSHDIRIAKDISTYDVNFVTLDKGVVLHMNHEGILEAFKAKPGSKDIIEIDDPAVDESCKLFAHGDQAMFSRGEKLYKFRMQQGVGAPAKTAGVKPGARQKRDKNTGLVLDIDGLKQNLQKKDPAFKKAYALKSGLKLDPDNDPDVY